MDSNFWLPALFAIFIAVGLSSVELLTKYQTRNLGEIFLSGYYFAFAALNALFCFLVYYFLPLLKIEVSSNLISVGEQPWIRAIVAGLGYLVIARTSVLDIKTPGGEPVGVGFDGIYNGVAQYLLGFHAKEVKKRIRDDFRNVHVASQDEPLVFLAATRILISQATTAEENKNLTSRLKLGEGQNATDFCFYLYNLIRDNSINAQDAAKQIKDQRTLVTENNAMADSLKKDLPWLYSKV